MLVRHHQEQREDNCAVDRSLTEKLGEFKDYLPSATARPYAAFTKVQRRRGYAVLPLNSLIPEVYDSMWMLRTSPVDQPCRLLIGDGASHQKHQYF